MQRSISFIVGSFILMVSIANAQYSDSLTVTEVYEAGEIYDPADTTTTRYCTMLASDFVLYGERSFFGVPSGVILRTPDLTAAPPVITDSSTPIALFESDGTTPYTGTLFHPTLVDAGAAGLMLYAIDAIPTGEMMLFTSPDGGAQWNFVGTPLLPGFGGGSGIVDVVTTESASHTDGLEVRVYYQDGAGSVRVVRSLTDAPLADKYFALDASTDAEVLAASLVGPGGFTATGEIVELDDGTFGFFFVPQNDHYIGYAESSDGLGGWSIARGSMEPLLSTAFNPDAPDPIRPEIKELTLVAIANGYRGYFTGAIAGVGGVTSRSIGALTIQPVTDAEFVRADCDGDGAVSIADAICALAYLFTSGPAACLDALDADDTGSVSIADAIYVLGYLFSSGPMPLPPFPDCGFDISLDGLDCGTASAGCP